MHHAIPTMNGLSTIEFQDNQPIMHEYNYYKRLLKFKKEVGITIKSKETRVTK